VQAKEDISEGKNSADQYNRRDHHQNISFARRRDEAWQVVGGSWVNRRAHFYDDTIQGVEPRSKLRH
jgi:hypothetical protein